MGSLKYLRYYYRILNKAFLEKRHKREKVFEYEGHHVKLNCLGGKLIVLLTAREHYLAHFLLYKHYKSNGNKNTKIKSARAFNSMTFQSGDNIKRYTSHTFEIARNAHYESLRGDNHPFRVNGVPEDFGKKVSKGMEKLSDEWRENAAENMLKVRSNVTPEQEAKRIEKVKEVMSQRTGEKNSMYGKPCSDENKKKKSEKMKGIKKSEEHCKNISLGWQKRKDVICHYCEKTSKNAGGMKRFHFENCKLKDKGNKNE